MTIMGFKKGKKKGRRPKYQLLIDKSNPNSTYWRDKADELFSDIVRSIGYCEICLVRGGIRKKDGKPVVGLDVHHLIERCQLGYRYNVLNGVSVCKSCHTYHPIYRHRNNNEFCFHGSKEQKEAAIERLKETSYEKYVWYQRHKDIKQRTLKVPYKMIYELLQKYL